MPAACCSLSCDCRLRQPRSNGRPGGDKSGVTAGSLLSSGRRQSARPAPVTSHLVHPCTAWLLLKPAVPAQPLKVTLQSSAAATPAAAAGQQRQHPGHLLPAAAAAPQPGLDWGAAAAAAAAAVVRGPVRRTLWQNRNAGLHMAELLQQTGWSGRAPAACLSALLLCHLPRAAAVQASGRHWWQPLTPATAPACFCCRCSR